MSTKNSVLAGIAGAAVASGVWYFATNIPQESSAEKSTGAPQETAMMLTEPEKPTGCPQRHDHAITFDDAKILVSDYVSTPGTPHLTSDGTNILKGWFLDRCIIEDLFLLYPESDGLQLYIGLKTNESNVLVNELTWMASQMIDVSGVMKRTNCVTIPETVMDIVKPCPNFCPEVRDLP